MQLQYENLALRQADKADAEQLASWWNDGAVMVHAGFPKGLNLTVDYKLTQNNFISKMGQKISFGL